MSKSKQQSVGQQTAVDEVLAEYLQRVDKGEAVDRNAFVADHPDVADALKSYFAGADEVDRVAGPVVGATSPGAATGHETVIQTDSESDAGIAPDTIPKKFGRYRVVRTLGRGAMGSVYLADDTQLDRQVALKIPNFAPEAREELLLRFNREAKAAATLSHPNICPVYDVGEIDGTHFISMGYIEGRPLSDYIDPDRPQPERQVASIIRKLAQALEESHEQGVVHRDVKPANIMIDKRREPIIMDFGLAQSIRNADEVRVTRDGMMVGTPAYMPPEQVKGEIDRIGPAADIYSLGVVMYELLTGQLPFAGTMTEVIARILNEHPQKPSAIRPGLDGRLEVICLKMMSKAIEDRHSSMSEVAETLSQFLKNPDSDQRPTAAANQPAVDTATAKTTNQSVSKHSPAKTPDGFDPYHKWLGIPPREQPPNHYRLLAIDLFEADLDVIEAAAVGRMTYVRQCAIGPHADASQTVLNDLSAAQICLLNPEQKTAYDARLKAELDAKAKTQPVPAGAETPAETQSSSKKTATAQPDADLKLEQQTRKLDKQKKQVESLLKQCEFAPAIDVLERMAAVKHPKLAKYSRWAKQQLPKAKRGPQEMRESSAALHRTAEQLFERNDYEGAAEILQQVPKKYRSPETKKLLQECLDRQAEVVVLLEDIDHAESLDKYEDLLPTVERLLELKPNDRRAKRLLKELKTYGKGGGMRLGHGDGSFDAVGSTFNPVKAVLFVVIPLALFGAVSWSVVVYVRSNDQTIKIEIDDPTAKVIIDGDLITITGVGDTVTLKRGMHELIVERGDVVVHTREFEVIKGKNPVLRITLEAEDKGPKPPGQRAADSPAVTPGVLAVAPFDAAMAKQHQQAWAKRLGADVETTNSIGMTFRLIPPGEFTMGSPQTEIEKLVKSTNDAALHEHYRSEGPQHQVTLTKPFYLGVYEVTQAQYQQVMGINPSYYAATGAGKDQVAGLDTGRYPVETVNSLDAVDFCIKLSQREGLRPCYLRAGNEVTILDGNGYRLPTEAEWEFACLAGTQTQWSFGNNEEELPQNGWFDSNSVGRTHAAGELRRNPFGLYDMHGNVWECCQDRYGPYGNGKRAVTDPRGPAQGNIVLRGGSFQNLPLHVRSAYRSYGQPGGLSNETGFRVARTGSGSQASAAEESPSIAVRFTGVIDGNDELRLYKSRANWNHRDQGWPTNMTLNGMDWNPRKNKDVPNSGKTRFMPDTVVFQDATLTIHKARGAIYFRKLKDHVYINFDDAAGGARTYDVTVRFPVPAGESQAVAAGPPAGTALTSPSTEVRFTGFIDGLDELRLYQSKANWNHRETAWPTNITLNGIDWDPQKNRDLPNSGKTRFMPDNVDFQDATLTIHKGRGAFHFLKEADYVYIAFVDKGAGGDTYDVTVRFPVPADSVISPQSDPQTQEPAVDGASRILKGHTGPAYAVAFSSNGKWFVSCGNDAMTRMWDVASGRQIRQFKAGDGGIVFSVAVSPDGKQIATSGTTDHIIRLWDAATGREIKQLKGHTDMVQAVAFSPDGRRLASGARDTSIRLWDVATGKQLGKGVRATIGITSVAFSPDAKKIVAGSAASDGGHVYAYNATNGRLVVTTKGHSDVVLSFAISGDGRRVLSCSGDNTVQLSDMRNGKMIRQFVGHTDKVGGVAFLAGEQYAVSGSFDGTVRFWDIETGKEVHRFQSNTGKHAVRGIAVSPDGSHVATAGLDSQVRLWRIPAALGGSGGSVTAAAVVCQKLESKRAPTRLNPQAVTFAAPNGNGRRGANGFLIDAPAGWKTKGTLWSCDFSRSGSSRGVIFIHPHLVGHVVATVTPTGLHLGSPGVWPQGARQRAYLPQYKGIPLQKSADFAQVFKLTDQSRQLTSKLTADGTYEFLLDGKVVATANITSALPLQFTETTKFTKQSVTEVAKGIGGVIIGPTDSGSARASQLRFGVIGALTTTAVSAQTTEFTFTSAADLESWEIFGKPSIRKGGGLECVKVEFDSKSILHRGSIVRTKRRFQYPLSVKYVLHCEPGGEHEIIVGVGNLRLGWNLLNPRTKRFDRCNLHRHAPGNVLKIERTWNFEHVPVVANRTYEVVIQIDASNELKVAIDNKIMLKGVKLRSTDELNGTIQAGTRDGRVVYTKIAVQEGSEMIGAATTTAAADLRVRTVETAEHIPLQVRREGSP